MPSKSEPQRRFMAMCSTPEGRAKAKDKCPPLKVAREFRAADRSGRDKSKAATTAQSYGFR